LQHDIENTEEKQVTSMEKPEFPHPDICEYLIPDKGIGFPLLVDLPHGGRIYPPDFDFSCPKQNLELCEERYLDELYAPPTLEVGGTILKANFPRTYIDPNRPINDIDPLLLETAWPDPVLENGRSVHGHGLIMRLIRAGEPIYTRRLYHHEIHRRIKGYYSNYHNMLNNLSNQIYEQFGTVYHLNCHSMPSSAVASAFPQLQPDFILGDMDGRSCGLEFRSRISEHLKEMGYRVAVNQLYKGAEIVSRYGQPAWGRHSLQIEINRALFQNESTMEKTNHFNRLKEDIKNLVHGITDH
jgi:N-formylglutamate amidohydrolase